MLEDRLTPSAGTFYWMGANTNGYGDTANWYRNADHSLPVSGDQVFVGNGSVSNDFTVPAAYTFAGLHLAHGFSGTVSLQDEASVGQLDVYDGSIAMVGSSGSGNDLYVTSSFTFTGGNLNSSSNTGTVHIQGVSTAHIGTDSGTVTTGSTLSVESGTTLYYAMGTINLTQDATMIFGGNSVVRAANPGAQQVGDGFVNTGNPIKQVVCKDTATITMEVKSGLAYVVTDNSTMKIPKSIEFKGRIAGDLPDPPTLQLSGNGRIEVQNGSTIKLEHGFEMTGGTFQTLYVATETNQTVTIDSAMKVTGGNIALGSPVGTASPDAKFSNLVATAHVSFTGGVFNCKVNGTPDSVERDLWTTVNTFTISAAAKLSPTVLYEPTGGVVGRSWSVIVAGRFSDAVLPTFPTGVTGWGASESGTDLVLTKKPPQ